MIVNGENLEDRFAFVSDISFVKYCKMHNLEYLFKCWNNKRKGNYYIYDKNEREQKLYDEFYNN